MSSKRAQRKKTFVNARIQGRIIARIAGYFVLYHVVLWHGMFIFRYAQHRAAVANGETTTPFRDLYHQFSIDYYPVLVCAAFILPIFMIDFVRLTHRIAGPLVRFRAVLSDLMDGKRVKSFELRKGDLLTEFEQDFNCFLGYYNARLDGLKCEDEHMTDEQAEAVESIVESCEEDAEEEAMLEDEALTAAQEA